MTSQRICAAFVFTPVEMPGRRQTTTENLPPRAERTRTWPYPRPTPEGCRRGYADGGWYGGRTLRNGKWTERWRMRQPNHTKGEALCNPDRMFCKGTNNYKVSSYDVQMYVRDDGSANRKAEGGSQQLSGGAKARETPSIGNWQSIGNWLLVID